jgi:hypothetical protein
LFVCRVVAKTLMKAVHEGSPPTVQLARYVFHRPGMMILVV